MAVTEERRQRRRQVTLRNIAFLAITYALAASAGQLLTLSPESASPIWPAAGVALASLLVGGLRLWPGIVVGNLVFHAVFFGQPDNLTGAILADLSLTAGVTLQAIAGAAMFNSRRRGLAVAREGRVFLTLLAAGPLACLIGATWGTTTLWASGAIQFENAFANWLLWWFGDSIGVLLFAPLTVLALPAGRRIWPERSVRILVPLLGATALLIPALSWFHANEEADARRPVELRADSAIDVAEERLRSAANAVLAVGHFMETGASVTPEQYAAFVPRMLDTGVRAIGWLPRVPAGERDAFESAARDAGLDSYRIREMNVAGDTRPAAARAEFFPVLYVESRAGTQRTLGVDLGAHPVRAEALQRAIDSGVPAATPPLALLPDGVNGVLLITPVYADGIDGRTLTPGERRSRLTGVVVGVLEQAALASALVTAASNQPVAFTVKDQTLPHADGDMFSIGEEPSGDDAPLVSRDIAFFGRSWRIDAYASEPYWQPVQTTRSRVFILATMLAVFVIAVNALASAARNRSIALKVAARTRELSENRRRLRSALSIASIGCWEYDVASHSVTLDDKYLAILGTTAAREGGYQQPARTWLERFVVPEDIKPIYDTVTALLAPDARRDTGSVEVRARRRDGEIIHLAAVFEVDRNTDGTPRRITGSTQDITERKLAELELRNSKEQIETINAGLEEEIVRRNAELAANERELQQTFDAAAVGIAHIDYAGRFLRVNPRMIEITGYSDEELRDCNPYRLLLPDDESDYQQLRDSLWDREVQTGFTEIRLRRKDGSMIWVSISLSAVLGTDGDIDYAMGIFEDISWRKQAEAELHQQQEINRLLLETLAEGVVACDTDGKLILFNKVAREWHGADLREIDAAEWSRYYGLFHADGQTPLAPDDIPLRRAWQGEVVSNYEMRIVPRRGPARDVLASGAPLLDTAGNKVGAVTVMHDITERKRAMNEIEATAAELQTANRTIEKERASLADRVAARTAELTRANTELALAKDTAESASRAKSAFLAVMSHEIRTPMNGIVGMVEVLAQSSLAASERDAVTTIRDSSFSLLRIIDDILDFSKIEADRLELELVPTSIADTVETICDGLAAEASGRNVDLRVFVDPAVPQSVMADPTRLSQLLYNLAGNAIKFSGGRESVRGRVMVRVESGVGSAGEIVFRIEDNGIGIKPDVLPTLFTSFTQAEASTTRRFGGTGLGLAISKRLVNLMGGEIAVESESGLGSTFTVILPLAVAGNATDKAGAASWPSLDGVECFLLDVDDEDCTAWCTYLATAGATAACVKGGVPETPAGSGRQRILLHTSDTTLEHSDLESLQGGGGAKHVLIAAGPRRSPRVIDANLVALQGSVVRRRDLVYACAIAAGRASPDLLQGESASLANRETRSPSIAEARANGQLILVAEDDPINQKVILRQLELLGYAGDVAGNGAEALEMWRGNRYGLLLTDLHMPEMDGYELVQNIRRQESGTRLPVIALSANAMRGEADRATDAGIDLFLTKPLQLSVLDEALRRWIVPAASEAPEERDGNTAEANGDRCVNLNILRDIVGDDDAIIAEFLGEFAKSSGPLLDDLRLAMARSDARRIAMLAHRQKGAARAIGATSLGDLCAELENAARSENFSIIFQLVARFELVSAQVSAEIEQALAADFGSNERHIM